MRIGVLGPLVVERDDRGATPALRGGQARRLTVALAMHAPDPVAVDVLDDLLWPDGAPSANALQAQVSKLRKVVAPLAIVGSPSGYALDAGADAIDALRFESLAVAGREAAARGEHARALTSLGDALGLWRGRPFDEIADHPLGQAPSARLSSMHAAAIAARLESLLAIGMIDDATVELEALVTLEPYVERWWALLMLARYRQGRPTDALRAYTDARRILADELGLEPGPELRELEARILRHDPALDGELTAARSVAAVQRAPASALPARVSSFVGRAEELDALAALATRSRLVTVVGPGGAGKTSTIIEVARRLSSDPGWPTFLVELARLAPGSAIAPAVAAAVGASRAGDSRGARVDELERVAEAVGDREVLMVFDNCEHVVDDAASVTHVLLTRCPHLRILTTSREALGVPGEVTWGMPPLRTDDAVTLLRERAGAVAPASLAGEGADERIAHLVERLDGLPLAIELAAARLTSMSLDDVVARLDDRFALLSQGLRTVEPRQQTLRNLVDWSHDLLDDAERIVFRRLAVFTGGASLAAAEAVCSDGQGITPADVGAAVGRLVDKSLVVVEHHRTGTRYRMLQTLADYASERLFASGEAEAVIRRHAEHVAAVVEEAERGLRGGEQRFWLAVLAAERANILAALDRTLAVDDADLALRIAAPLGWYFFMVDETALGIDVLTAALSCSGWTDARLRSLALGGLGWLAASGPDMAVAIVAVDEVLRTLGTYDDPFTECFVLCTSVMTFLFGGEIAECEALMPMAVAAAERSGDRWVRAITTLVGAEILQQRGDMERAEREMSQASDAFAALGDRFAEAVGVTEAAEIAEIRGDYDRAIRVLEQNLAVADDVGFSMQPFYTRTRIANLEVLRGNIGLATSMHRQILDVPTTTPWLRAVSLLGMANIGRRTGDLELAERSLDEAWSLPRTHAVPLLRSSVRVSLAYTADQRGDGDRALSLALAGLADAEEFGSVRAIANAVEAIAGALALGRDPALAAQLLGAADSVRRSSGGPMPAAERFDVGRAEQRARTTLGEAPFEAEFAAGAMASCDELVAAARAIGTASEGTVTTAELG
jgi:predicted ATPase/DNA-binding SARP family transcriptional activator